MNPYAQFGLEALAVLLTGVAATLTDFQTGHDWTAALIVGGVTVSITGLAQLAKSGIVTKANAAAFRTQHEAAHAAVNEVPYER